MSDMTLITDMALPDAVVEAAAEAIEFEFMNGAFVEDVSVDFKFPARLAIRAALQAMCDCGMAELEEHVQWKEVPPDESSQPPKMVNIVRNRRLIIRLDADERKEQT